MKKIFDETGQKPVVLSSYEYGTILEGASYVTPWIEHMNWLHDLPRARRMAEQRFGWCIVPKWWDDPQHVPPPPINGQKVTVLHIAGRKIELPESEWDSYQLSQWRACGFKTEDMLNWPLIFDNRSKRREEELVRRTFRNSKPKILVNLTGGGSSRFGYDWDVLKVVNEYRNHFEIVNLASVVGTRIYDLLGIMERAEGMITCDTSTLHLAGACRMPYVAYIANGGGGSIPKGNCVAAIRYGDTLTTLNELRRHIEYWK